VPVLQHTLKENACVFAYNTAYTFSHARSHQENVFLTLLLHKTRIGESVSPKTLDFLLGRRISIASSKSMHRKKVRSTACVLRRRRRSHQHPFIKRFLFPLIYTYTHFSMQYNNNNTYSWCMIVIAQRYAHIRAQLFSFAHSLIYTNEGARCARARGFLITILQELCLDNP
jgi:hypothetical protein